MSSPVKLFGILLIIALLVGCSNTKRYVDEPNMNVQVVAKIKAGGILSSSSGSVDIFKVDEKCHKEYLGSKTIKGSPVKLGLPAGQKVYLSFNFRESSILSGSSRNNSMSGIITPRSKTFYYFEATYDGTFQDLHVFEQKGKKKREIQYEYLMDCMPK